MKVWVLVSWTDNVEGVVSSEARARELGFSGQDDNGVGAGRFTECEVDAIEDEP